MPQQTPPRLREPAPDVDGHPTPEAAPIPRPKTPTREQAAGKAVLRDHRPRT